MKFLREELPTLEVNCGKYGKDPTEFLKKNNPDVQTPVVKLYKEHGAKSLVKYPLLRDMEQYHGKGFSGAFIFANLFNFIQFHSLETKCNLYQVDMLADTLALRLEYWTFIEVLCFFGLMKQGTISVKFYGRFDPAIITSAIDVFEKQIIRLDNLSMRKCIIHNG